MTYDKALTGKACVDVMDGLVNLMDSAQKAADPVTRDQLKTILLQARTKVEDILSRT